MSLKKQIIIYTIAIVATILVSLLFSSFFGRGEGYTSIVVLAVLFANIFINNKERQAQKANTILTLKNIDYITIFVAVAVGIFVAEGVVRLLDKLF